MWIQKVRGGGIDGLAYSSDGRALYTADRSGMVTAWDTATHNGQRLFGYSGITRRIAFTADRYLVMPLGGYVFVWNLKTAHTAGTFRTGSPYDGTPVPGNDERVLHLSADRRALLAWAPGPITAGTEFAGPFPGEVRAYDISPDTTTVAFSLDANYGTDVNMFDRAKKRVMAQFPVGYEGSVWGVRFSPDGRTLATFSGHHVRLWNVSSQTQPGEAVSINNRYGEATFAFHPTAPMFVALDHEKNLTLFSSETGAAIRSFDFALGKYVRCVCFSPDGLTCAVGGSNKQFAVFDVDV